MTLCGTCRTIRRRARIPRIPKKLVRWASPNPAEERGGSARAMGHMPRASFLLPWMLGPEVAMRTGKIPRATRGLTLRRGRRAPGRKPPHVSATWRERRWR
jgi:hypothetical protein